MDAKKILIIAVVVLVLIFAGLAVYFYGGSGSSINSGLSSARYTASQVSPFSTDLEALTDLHIDPNPKIRNDQGADIYFFSNPTPGALNPNGDPVFRSLVNHSSALCQEPNSRVNPFLPINDQEAVPIVPCVPVK